MVYSGSSMSSEINSAENSDLEHETIPEVATEILLENFDINIEHLPTFACPFCSVTCTSESLLEKHEKLRHPLFKTKLIKTNFPFSCSLCKRFYKTYTSS